MFFPFKNLSLFLPHLVQHSDYKAALLLALIDLLEKGEFSGNRILLPARLDKAIDGETSPFLFLGPAKNLHAYESNRPIKMIWKLEHPVPAELFEAARAV